MRLLSSWLACGVLLLGCGASGPGPLKGTGGGAGEARGGEGGDSGSGGGVATTRDAATPGGAGGSDGVAGTSGTGGLAGGGGVAGTGGEAGTGGDGGSGGEGGTTADAGAMPDGAVLGDGGIVISPIPPGMTQIFDGKTLMGWTGSTAIWSVDATEMAIHGKTANGGQLLKSAGDYDDFRLIVTEKAVATMNHMGLCFWGTRPGNGYGGCLDAIPPSGHFWDYGGGGDVPNTGVGSANNGIKFMWHQVEILALASTGEVLVAVNGKQVTMYKKAGRGKKGPIGLQAHAGASDQMYKDIWVEANPKEHRLLTVK
jgi:hypothetical protein